MRQYCDIVSYLLDSIDRVINSLGNKIGNSFGNILKKFTIYLTMIKRIYNEKTNFTF
jgi:hypothetical protein